MKKRIFGSIFALILLFLSISCSYAEIKIFFSPNGGATEEIIKQIDKAENYIDISMYSFTSEAIVKAEELGIRIPTFRDEDRVDGKHWQYKYFPRTPIERDRPIYVSRILNRTETMLGPLSALLLSCTESIERKRSENIGRTDDLRATKLHGDELPYSQVVDRAYSSKKLDHETKTTSAIFSHASVILTEQESSGNKLSEAENDNIIFFTLQIIMVMIAFAVPLLFTLLYMIWNAESRELELVHNLLKKNKKKNLNCLAYLANQIQEDMKKMRKWIITLAALALIFSTASIGVALNRLWGQGEPPKKFLILMLLFQWVLIVIMFVVFQIFGPLRKLHQLRNKRQELDRQGVVPEETKGGNKK